MTAKSNTDPNKAAPVPKDEETRLRWHRMAQSLEYQRWFAETEAKGQQPSLGAWFAHISEWKNPYAKR